MEVISQIQKMQDLCVQFRKQDKKIGLVPTMGYLHRGHLSLALAARKENDVVVMSDFVNPLQFGPREDFATYPRDLDRDCQLAESVGVDYVFAPVGEEMYPEGYNTHVEVLGEITEKMCARSRSGHFKGVATVVLKLFNIVQPDRAYFGQKDAQQAVVIRKMAADLNIPLEIVTCPIIREADGLALSSRNTYLTPEDRKCALALPRALEAGRKLITGGERNSGKVREEILAVLNKSPGIEVDYVEVVNGRTLADMPVLAGPVLLAAAVRAGKTRLIDNIDLEVEQCSAQC